MTSRTRMLLLSVFMGLLLGMLVTSLYQRTISPSLVQVLPRSDVATLSPSESKPDLPVPPPGNNTLHPALATQVAALMPQLQKTPTDLELLLKIAGIFLEAQEWQQAEIFLDKAAQAAPGDFRPSYFLGISKSNQKHYAEAAVAFEKSLQQKLIPATQFNLAILYKHHLDQAEKAKKLLQEVIALSASSDALRARAQQELAQ